MTQQVAFRSDLGFQTSLIGERMRESRSREPSLSSFTCQWTYDVFLNFRGEDTRHNFTGHLYKSLCQRGIRTFIDDEGLKRGEEITPALLKAIHESTIAIIVFSKNYASSTYCLDELVKILKSLKEERRLAWPIFYDVEPSQVRHQTGTYAESFLRHERRFKNDGDKLRKWRKALRQAADLSGWHFQFGHESEYKFIEEIVEAVSKMVSYTPLHVADKPVGLESSVVKVEYLLGYGSDVNMVGIYGIGGIGKTTIARAVYNRIAHEFEGLCFLFNIREKAINKDGLVQLQEMLISEILGDENIKVRDVNRGIPIIRRRLQQKKILLILDDVDQLDQLKVLAGGLDWFGSGSKIIITTRDKQLLVSHGVVKLHEVKQLNDKEALELFSWHAFKSNKPNPSYMDISNRVVSYACGLPLALEVIGSYLFGKSLVECCSALDKYESVPHDGIHEILKVSYYSLDGEVREIFLDIACFFDTYKMVDVKEMLHARGFHVEDGIRVLLDKSLIKIDAFGHLEMHDLIRDMGREIVRQESKNEPGNRSRLWFDKDIVHVLEENTGTDKIEVVMLKGWNDKEVRWNGKAFKKMRNLRILIIGNAIFSTGPHHLPNSLRVLDWSGYPSPDLPPSFNPKELLILSLPQSCLKFFQQLKRFRSVSSINFKDCKFLTELPSLCEVPLIRHLCLDNCTNLIRVHGSVGFLDNLISLSATGCTQLEILVPRIELTSLEKLDITGCSRLKSFPEVSAKMDKIRHICLEMTGIEKLPFSFGNLVGLELLDLKGSQLKQLPGSIHSLPRVKVIFRDMEFDFVEDKKKVISEVSPSAMVVYVQPLGFTNLDLFYTYVSPNNVIQVGTPKLLERLYFRFLFTLNENGHMNRYSPRSRETSMRFCFRKKFPKIALCCCGVPRVNRNNLVLDYNFNVLVNGTKQLSFTCNYITTWHSNSWSQMFWCDLQCKAEGAFSEHEWNEVEILCELDYPEPCGLTRVWDCHKPYNSDWKMETGGLRWTLIYVYKEGNIKEDIDVKNPWKFPSPVTHHVSSSSIPWYMYNHAESQKGTGTSTD